MMKRFLLLLSAGLLLTAAACSTAKSNLEASPSSAAPSASASASAQPEAAPVDKGKPVKANHLSILLPSAWTTQNGEESFTFQNGGTPVGGLDGLGYNDTLEGLLPNGATVDSQTELKDFPVKTIEAKLTIKGEGEDDKREELHYFFFLADQKVVYDLRFDAKQVQEDEAMKMAKTATVF